MDRSSPRSVRQANPSIQPFPVPPFRDFHDGMWKGEITLHGNDARLQYGRVHLNQLWENIWTPRYRESLRLLSEWVIA